MKKRTVTKISDLQLKPFDRYGKPIPKLSWHPISYDKKSNHGSYILKFETGGKSLKHKHLGSEEFLVLEGSLKDSDNTEFKAGDFVTFESGSSHFSTSDEGCLLLVFMRGINEQIK